MAGDDEVQKSEIDVYNFETNAWTKEITCGNEPPSASICSIHAIPTAKKIISTCQGRCSTRSDNVFNRIDILDVSSKPFCWNELQLEWCGDWTLVPGTGCLDFASAFDLESGVLFVYGGKSELHNKENGNNDEFHRSGHKIYDLSMYNNLIMVDLKTPMD